MTSETLSAQLRGFNAQGLAAPLIVIMMLAMVVIPLPPMVLDLLFTFNITFGPVMFLLSPDNGFVTGQCIFVCGGASLGSLAL